MPTLPEFRVGLGGFLPAEEALIAGHPSGEVVVLGDGTRPEAPSGDTRLRAAFLRALFLNRISDLPCHDKGLRVAGAWIEGTLDLEGCDCPRGLVLSKCSFERAPVLIDARLRLLHLGGCKCPGISADRLEVSGDVHLRATFLRSLNI